MDRVRRLHRLWSWLPAYRAVAETEHLHDAAARLSLTPSTLSRAIHLLQDDIGVTLFERVGRGIRLTENGRTVATALRDAMRRLDDALVAIGGGGEDRVRITCAGALEAVAVIPALAGIGIAASVATLSANDDVTAGLRSGMIDLAFVTASVEHPEVVVDRVGDLHHAIVGNGPSFISCDELPPPPAHERVIALRVTSVAAAIAAVEAGLGRAVLPTGVSPSSPRDGGSAEIAVPVFAARREGANNRAHAAVIDRVRGRLAQLAATRLPRRP